MKVLVYMGHPAHFWYLINAVRNLKKDGHNVVVLIKKKEILETLLKNADIPYVNILEEGRKDSTLGMAWGTLKRLWRSYKLVHKQHFNLLIGTSVENSFVGPLCGVSAVYCGEDDYDVAPIEGGLSYPGAKNIMTPFVCDNGKWDKSGKVINYPSYHELAYLHPNHFIPQKDVVEKYGIDTTNPYFIIRFVKLTANHDMGIRGINKEIAQRLVDILKPYGQIYITSERPLEPEFESYRIKINPLDMHHVMAFASLYIGDSQTMAAEAGVLGTPFVRFNDFVGRIGYLDELEEKQSKRYVDYLNLDHHYDLGVGIRASEEGSVERLCQTVEGLASMSAEERKRIYGERCQRMLADKIDYAKFLTWFIEKYPNSADITKKADTEFWQQFK